MNTNTNWVHNTDDTYELHFNQYSTNEEVVAVIKFNEREDEWVVENTITGYTESYSADEGLDTVMVYARESVIEYYDDMIDYYTTLKEQFEAETEE